MLIKKCTKCGIEKTLEGNFRRRSDYKDKWMSWCRDCERKCMEQYNKEYRKSEYGKIKIHEYNTRSDVAAKRKKYIKETLNGRYSSYKYNAKTRNLEWDLTKEEFALFWQKPCMYCKSKIETIGLDRKNNNKGYVLENVTSCCKICNKMKLNLSIEEFMEKIFKMSERIKKGIW